MNIAIDGPVASGKGTVSRLAAQRLGLLYVDTGALYRAISVYCDWQQVDLTKEKSVCALISQSPPQIKLRRPVPSEQDGRLCTVILNHQDVSWEIRTDRASRGSSLVARYLCVRDFLLDLQRDLAQKNEVIMEGRDITSFVLPTADLKIFLTADLATRARRRHLEHLARGDDLTYEQVLQEIRLRDRQDSRRALRPLRQTPDAFKLDTSHLTIEQVVDKIVLFAHEKIRSSKSARS